MMFGKIGFDRAVAIAVALLAAGLLLLVNEGAYWKSRSAMDTMVVNAESRFALQRLMENVVKLESAQRGYVLSGNETLLNGLSSADAAMADSFRILAQQHSDHPQYVQALARARAQIEARLAVVSRAVALRQEGNINAANDLILLNTGTMGMISSLDDELVALEDVGRAQRHETVYTSLLVARIGAMVVIALGLLVLLIYMRHTGAVRKHQIQIKAAEQVARTELQTEVTLRTTELTDLTRYLLVNREDERSRLARNLHDDLGALLTSAKLDVARIKTRMAKSAPESLDLLAHLVTTLNACVALGRNIIENLRPSALENLGLTATLEILTSEFAKTSGIETRCELEPVPLSASAELMVYRVVQEALTNISRYAEASLVVVTLRARGNEMQLGVSDNGRGFDPRTKPPSAYGLQGMRFRVEAEGGTLSIISSPGEGTQISAVMTLAALNETPALK